MGEVRVLQAGIGMDVFKVFLIQIGRIFFTNVLGFLQEKVKSYSRRLIHAFGIAADQDPQKIGQDNFNY